MGYVPNFIHSIPKFNKMMSKDIIIYCETNKLSNIILVINLAQNFLSYLELTEIGEFIARTKIMNIEENLNG